MIGAALVLSATPVFAQTVAAGVEHSVILKSDGTVWAVGGNSSGQLGDGTTTSRNSPVQVSSLTGVVAIAAGSYHSMAITSTGALYLWGANESGQLGDASTTSRSSPVQSSLTSVVAVSGGEAHTVALLSNGEIYTWGLNERGQLGTGNTTSRSTPGLLTTGVAIAAGGRHSVFVKSDGTAYATGHNQFGALGDTTTTTRTAAVQMSGISTAVKAAAGSLHTLLLLSDGTVKSAGYNPFGQLGDTTGYNSSTPVAVSGLTGVAEIAAGQFHSMARKSDGTVHAWGWNYYGQIGDSTTTDRYSAVSISGLSSMTGIGGGAEHSIAVSSTGVVYTWGRNNAYQLGDGTTTSRTAPNAISDADFAWKVSKPTISVAGGTYTTIKTVTIAVATSGATIRYTQNGNEPTESDSSITSGGTLTISISQTLKVKAFKTGFSPSTTASETYVLKVAAVSASPAGGAYTSAQSVTLSTATSGAAIYYTTDGSTPTTSSAIYSTAISIPTTTVLKAVGGKADWSNSDVAAHTYAMNFGTLPAPTADQATGNYVNQVTVALSSISGATIRYTTNNTAVQSNSTIYTAPLAFDVTTTLRFKAFHPDYSPSAEVTATYTLAPSAPAFDPTAGTYLAGQLVTVTAATSGSTIRYTINGAEPTTSDPSLTSGSSLVLGNFTLKAKAWKTGTNPSATTSATYNVSGTVTPPALAAGNEYSLAIRNDGVAWGWGYNGSGQLGLGASTAPKLLPQMIPGITGVAAIDGGTGHTHAVLRDGAFVGFGDNTYGRLGDGTTTARYLATTIASPTAVVRVSDGDDHTVALKGDGTVYAWGYNDFGQVGDGTTTQRTSAVAIASLTSMSAVSAGQSYSLALKQDGTIWSWGRNGIGQLGRGDNTDSSSPVTVSTITTATAIDAGQLHALALLADGTVRAWGYNFYGQLGDGTVTARNSPVAVSGLDRVVAIRAGGTFSMALKDDGTVWTWGDNWAGSLGDGTTINRAVPVQVTALSDIVAIAAGRYHALAMTSAGVVFAWGLNSSGQLGDGTTTNQLTPFAISGPGMNWRVATPTISLASGFYYAEQTATVDIPDPTATLRYTTTGVDPISSDATVTPGGTIAISQSQTLKVSGWRTGAVTSVVVSRSYELKAVAPTMTPGTGAYGSAQTVAISTTTSGASLRYTTDGTEPTTSSTAYSSAITIADTRTVKARAYKTGWTASDSTYAGYWISSGMGTVAPPVVTPTGGAHLTPPLVSMSTATGGATLRYTLDGTTPTATSAIFTYPFLVPVTTTVSVKAFKAGFMPSATTTVSYAVDASGATATPAIVPAGGWFATQQTVTITGPSGSTLRYTTDGTDPTASSTSITSGSTITVNQSQVVKVRAWASGLADSAVRRADFVITGAISAGSLHSLALASNGSVWAFGSDWSGQLGNGAAGNSLTPVQVLTGAVAIAAGDRHSLAAKADGTVWAWGDGASGKLGNGGYGGSFTSPTQISFSGAIAVAAGSGHSLVLKSDGTVWAFGSNTSGQLGNGTTNNTNTPVQVTGVTGIVAIAVGANSSYALQSDGAEGGILWAWGANSYGEVGDGSMLPRPTPVRVTGVPSVAAMAAGKLSSFALAIGADGRAYGWGRNQNFQLGLGVTADQTSAMALPVITTGRLIGAGSDYGVAIDGTGRAWAWGDMSTTALGVGPTASQYDRTYVPEQSDIGGVLSVAGGDRHTLAIKPNGTIVGFGENGGRLGNGSSDPSIDGVVASGLTLADNTFLAGDADQDDLATWREYLLGTDPLNADSNGNGVLDGLDVASGASAADPDTDDDGVPNWTERLNGTDPFRADTDGDGVSDLNDAFPLDPTRSMAPSPNPADTTPPMVTLKEPVSARRIP